MLEKWKAESIPLSLNKIPKGEILLNDDRLGKKWPVSINEFFISENLLTQDLYLSVTGESPSAFKGRNRPVENVTWKEAAQFCNQISIKEGLDPCYTFLEHQNKISFNPDKGGFRLPTEAEWQYACQATNLAIRYGKIDDIAWYKENADQQTQEVGMKKANDWGLYDMLGNVWEWCTDVYDEEVYGRYRILRGGGWADEERSVMATTRRRSHPEAFRIDDLGFRIAKNG